jgi:hypothetical protein
VEEIAMIVTLPACGKEVEVQSLSRKQMLRMDKIDLESAKIVNRLRGSEENADEDIKRLETLASEREALVRTMYPSLEPCWEDLPNRDLLLLTGATMDYSRNVPEEEIKNWIRSGNGEATRTE